MRSVEVAVVDCTRTVLVVDDHEIFRRGLSIALSQEPGFTVVGEAENGQQAVALFQALRPHLVLMDLKMPLMDGPEAIRAIRAIDKCARILIVTAGENREQIVRGMGAGAYGIVSKQAPRSELFEAIQVVMAIEEGSKERYLGADLIKLPALIEPSEERLTERELQVLRLVALSNSDQQIADTLGLALSTVKFHLRNINSKFGCDDRFVAVVEAIKRGFLSLV